MRKRIIIITTIILTIVLIFILGRFHFSSIYILGRDISVNKINDIDCGFWKNNDGGIDSLNFDLLEFKESNRRIKNDTLYFGEIPIAIASRLVHRCFIDYELTLKSFDGRQTQYFVSK